MPSAHASPPGIMPLRPSKILTCWVVFCSVSAATLSLLYLPVWVALAVCLLILGGASAALRLHALKTHTKAVVAIRCDASMLHCQLKSGHWISGPALPGGLISTWLTVVRVKDTSVGSASAFVVLMPDCMGVEDYRRLRVFLRWVRTEHDGGAA